jgi:hypothetical protein
MSTEPEKANDPGAAGRPEGGKKRYTPPALVCYGSVAKLTQSGNLSGTDRMGMMGCL